MESRYLFSRISPTDDSNIVFYGEIDAGFTLDRQNKLS